MTLATLPDRPRRLHNPDIRKMRTKSLLNHPSGYLLLLAATVGLLVVAGCGGSTPSGSDRDQIVKTAHDYGTAVASGDYARACDLMTSQGKVQFEKAAAFIGATGGCENAVRAASDRLSPPRKAALRAATVTAVRINGDRATARYVGSPDPVELQKTSGTWLVDIPASGS